MNKFKLWESDEEHWLETFQANLFEKSYDNWQVIYILADETMKIILTHSYKSNGNFEQSFVCKNVKLFNIVVNPFPKI